MRFFQSLEKDDFRCEKIWFRSSVQIPRELYPVSIKFTGWSRCSAGWKYEHKKTDIFGIEYVCAGNAALLQDGKEFLVNRGEVFLIRKNVNHRYWVGPKDFLLKRFIVFDGIELDNIVRYLNLWDKDHIVLRESKKFEKLMKQMTDAFSEPVNEFDLGIKVSSLAYQILLLLSGSVRLEYPPVIEKALEFMKSGLNKSLTREQLCEHVGMSIQHFNRIFTSYMHCSPINYFLRQKMDWAANLLKTTALSVKEIAYMLGYDNPLYFSGQFKKHLGISPISYRTYRNYDEK